MAEILLSSEKFIKETTNVSENLSGKYLLPSLREAQEIGLKGILGDCLLARLKQLVKDGEINQEDNTAYKDLLDRCQYYLAYQTIVEVVERVSYKVVNFGVAKTTDENLQVATQDEIAKQKYFYQAKADNYCLDLQNFLLNNRTAYPELKACDCNRIQANLKSAASCGIFLGGARGRKTRR
jgi:hypothetical protein